MHVLCLILIKKAKKDKKKKKRENIKKRKEIEKKSFSPAVLHLLCTSLNLPRPTAPVLGWWWWIKKGSLISLKIGSVVVKDKLNFAIYENLGLFFEKFEKILISSWKLGKLWWNFGNFGSKIQTWRGHFFCSPETWHTCRTWKVKFRNFRVLWFCKKKSEKNPIQVWKVGKNLQKIST